jgi:signal transduction histidine kinase
MSQEQLSQLFHPEQSTLISGTSPEKGTGLGLILCKEFIDMHDGDIWAESEPGKGTSFTFTLPDKKSSFTGDDPEKYKYQL